MRTHYLTGESVYLRSMLAGDKEHAAAWFDSPFPINATRAEQFLKEELKGGWPPGPQHLVICRVDGDAIAGGATIRSWNWRVAWLTFRMAPWAADADDLQAETVRLVIPWLRDERELMVVRLPIAADQPATLAAAEAVGMVQGVRLRERLARPGGRIDQFFYEALNPRWEVRHA